MALPIKLDLMSNNYIQFDRIFSKFKILKIDWARLEHGFPNSCLSINVINSIFVIIPEAYSERS